MKVRDLIDRLYREDMDKEVRIAVVIGNNSGSSRDIDVERDTEEGRSFVALVTHIDIELKYEWEIHLPHQTERPATEDPRRSEQQTALQLGGGR